MRNDTGLVIAGRSSGREEGRHGEAPLQCSGPCCSYCRGVTPWAPLLQHRSIPNGSSTMTATPLATVDNGGKEFFHIQHVHLFAGLFDRAEKQMQ